jgi:hypothetical protein
MTDIFLDLQETLDRDLRATGFAPDDEPPGLEPKFRGSVSGMHTEEIKDLYDTFLAFHGYVSEQHAQAALNATIAEARWKSLQASFVKESQADSSLRNADLRKAAIATDPNCLSAQRDHVYFKSTAAAHEKRLQRMSKVMARLARELWHRTQETDMPYDFSTRSGQPDSGRAASPRGYKIVKTGG